MLSRLFAVRNGISPCSAEESKGTSMRARRDLGNFTVCLSRPCGRVRDWIFGADMTEAFQKSPAGTRGPASSFWKYYRRAFQRSQGRFYHPSHSSLSAGPRFEFISEVVVVGAKWSRAKQIPNATRARSGTRSKGESRRSSTNLPASVSVRRCFRVHIFFKTRSPPLTLNSVL
jgi:hypothetical protein